MNQSACLRVPFFLLQEVVLEGEGGEPVLRCAIVNGFRNIQTLMRQLKSKRCLYHYVEVRLAGGGDAVQSDLV